MKTGTLSYCLILTLILLLAACPVHADGLSGWFNINQSNAENKEEGEKISSSDTFDRNLYLSLNKSLTPLVGFDFTFRTNFRDSDDTDAADRTTTTYRRSMEPSFNVSLHNPMYYASFGYQRLEEWTTANLTNDTRKTGVFYYSRFGVSPLDLPSLSLDINRSERFDYLDEKAIDNTTNVYRLSSDYVLPSRALDFRYGIDITRSESRDRVGNTPKTIADTFSLNYSAGYHGKFWDRKGDYHLRYNGNFSRSKNRRYVSETGSLQFERPAINGLYDFTVFPALPEDDDLVPTGALVDDDVITPMGINLSTANIFHNIGVRVSPATSVDRLYIYVDEDVTGAGDLNTLADWEVWRSDSNTLGTWSAVGISTINVSLFDAGNTIYRYEIIFTASQNASYFRAINQTNANTLSVEVTEIEAYGTDIVETEVLKDITTSFSQGLGMTASIRPLTVLTFAFNFSLDRRDTNPSSVYDSIGGLFNNVVSDSIPSDKSNFRSDVSRNYGASATWQTLTMLTTVARVQRNENFDNLDQSDFDSNLYGLTFHAILLPTLSSSLSFTRGDQFTFNEKTSTNDAAVLSFDSKLYRDVNMINDFGYTKSQTFATDTISESQFANGTIDATITRRLSGTVSYQYNRTTAETTSTTQQGFMRFNYNPGNFVNLTGNIDVFKTEGQLTIGEGIGLDWLPVRVLRLNVDYRHLESDADESTTDTFGGSAIWYVKRFIDLRTTYGYSIVKQEIKRESYNISSTLNCRF